MTKTFKVEGMACGHCVAHVKHALETLPGVKAEVSLEPALAKVDFADKEYSIEELQAVVTEEAGDYILSE